MKPLTLSLLAGCATALFGLAPMALAQPPEPSSAMSPDHGNWTLKEREGWLHDHLDKARDEGSIDRHEYARVRDELTDIHHDEDRMRDHHDGQLTDNDTTALEGRLDAVAHQIHWLRVNSFQMPW